MISTQTNFLDTKSWTVIYPVYLNSKKTLKQGRQIPLSAAVSNPSLDSIAACVKKLNLQCVQEPDKAYSRDPNSQIGRLRVQLKTAEKEPVIPEIPNRSKLLLAIAKNISELEASDVKTTTKAKKKGKKK